MASLALATILSTVAALAALRGFDLMVWSDLRPHDTPRAGVPLWLGAIAAELVLATALVPFVYRRVALWRSHLLLRRMFSWLHIPLALAALTAGVFHAAGHLDLQKSGDALLAVVLLATFTAVIGRALEARNARLAARAKSSGAHHRTPLWLPTAARLWRRGHRIVNWLVVVFLAWHLGATSVYWWPVSQMAPLSERVQTWVARLPPMPVPSLATWRLIGLGAGATLVVGVVLAIALGLLLSAAALLRIARVLERPPVRPASSFDPNATHAALPTPSGGRPHEPV